MKGKSGEVKGIVGRNDVRQSWSDLKGPMKSRNQ